MALGARYDYYREIGGQLSPRLGLIQQVGEHNTIKLLYGEAFRTPALSEIGAINMPGQSNSQLTYETIKTLELVWRGEWKHLAAGVNAFHSRYDDPIAAGFVGGKNNGDFDINGVEFESSQEFMDYWMLQASFTRLLELPDESFREADHFGSLSLNFSYQKWNWNLASVYQAERETLAQPNVRYALSPFWFANTKLAYQFSDTFTWQLHIKNMFDKSFSTPANEYSPVNGIPNRGRVWSLGLQWDY
ncbi:MAG: hypothetical protein RL497_2919 [Pseudomonadota bacterium]